MPSADKQKLDDEVLSRYLLGSLPAEEAERLDELSVADDEFALRLDAVENDLVDAFARGDLSGKVLEQFKKFYLFSPKRREKVEFARTLLRFGEKTAAAVAAATTRPAIPEDKPSDQTTPQFRSPRRWFTIPRLDLQWGFASAAMVMLITSSYLFVENERLRKQGSEAREQQTVLDHRSQELQRQLAEQQYANAGMLKELDQLREASASSHGLKIVTALLLPQMRGASQVPTVSVPAGTDRVQLRLRLESDDFPAYQVALKDASASRVIWHKSNPKKRAEGDGNVVFINIPAALLKQRNYLLEITGVPSQGIPEVLSSYAFKVVVN